MAACAMTEEASVALAKAQRQILRRRLKLQDFFSDFDRLRCGRISANQFSRVLTTNGVVLSEAEMKSLVNSFGAPADLAETATKSEVVARAAETCSATSDGPREVRYVDFLAALANDATVTTAAGAATIVDGPVTGCTLTASEETQLQSALATLRHTVRTRNLHLLPPFKDLDPLHTGKVTCSQFSRCLPFPHLDDAVLRLFAKRYGDGAGSVYYRAWCRDVDPATTSAPQRTSRDVTRAPSPGFSPASVFFGGSCQNAQLTSEQLVRILREQFALYRLRCEDYLRDFDPFNTGVVLASQFESALGRLSLVKFALTAENIQCLVNAYAVHPDVTNPTLCAGAAANLVRVNYRNFLHDTNPKNAVVEGAGAVNYFNTTHAADTFLTTDDSRASAERVLDHVRRLVKSNRIFLSPVLRDFDRVRKAIYEHRTCTRSRFARALATYNLRLADEQLRVLVQKYTVPHADGTPSGEVNYYQFVQDVDPTQAQPPQPCACGDAATALSPPSPPQTDLTRPHLSDTDAVSSCAADATHRPATQVDEVLYKIARQAATRELRVGDFFTDFDALRSGRLQLAHFVTALGIAGVQLQGAELDLLGTVYADPTLPQHVRVETFLRDVGAYVPQATPHVCPPDPAATNAALDAATNSTKLVGSRPRFPRQPLQVTRHPQPSSPSRGCTSATQQAVLDRLLQRLRHDTKAHSALLTPFFADFDRFHTKKISRTNFIQALARHRFVLSQEDTDLLCAVYADDEDANRVAYQRFVRDVGCDAEAASAGTNDKSHASLESIKGTTAHTANPSDAPATQPDQNTRTTPKPKQDNTTSALGEEEEEIFGVLNKIGHFVQQRQPRLAEFFRDGDELHHGHVSVSRFRHCLSILGPLDLTERDFALLERAFAHATLPNEIDYNAFVQAVRDLLGSKTARALSHQNHTAHTNRDASTLSTTA